MDIERKYVSIGLPNICTAAHLINSDGPTPEKQTEQILAITPILRGQKPSEKNPIPPPHQPSEPHASTLPPSTATPIPPSQSQPQTQRSEQSDLIDFGQHDGASNPSPKTGPHEPPDLLAAQTQNGGQQQKDLEAVLRATSNVPDVEDQGGSLNDFHEDIKRDLPVMGKGFGLTRHDTETGDSDEFVDAEG